MFFVYFTDFVHFLLASGVPRSTTMEVQISVYALYNKKSEPKQVGAHIPIRSLVSDSLKRFMGVARLTAPATSQRLT